MCSETSYATAASITTEGSRRSLGSTKKIYKDLQKWSLPTVRAEDIEVCRRLDGSPIELGRGGFCRVSPYDSQIQGSLAAILRQIFEMLVFGHAWLMLVLRLSLQSVQLPVSNSLSIQALSRTELSHQQPSGSSCICCN